MCDTVWKWHYAPFSFEFYISCVCHADAVCWFFLLLRVFVSTALAVPSCRSCGESGLMEFEESMLHSRIRTEGDYCNELRGSSGVCMARGVVPC